MTNRELLELASLDAMGLLDDQERRAFEEAFRQASPAMQAQVRREQERLADLEADLPAVEPPQGLRERVLAAVRDAMQSVPGRRRVAGVVGRVAPAEWSVSRNVSPLWRAACIGFATATVVLMAVGFQMRDSYEDALLAFRDREIADLITQQLGPGFVDKLLSPASEKVSFRPTDQTFSGKAAVLFDRESQTAFLVCKDLPALESQYRLVVMEPGSREAARVLARFESNGGLRGWPVQRELEPGATLAILPPPSSDQAEKPILRSL